jgi:pyruvate/2-oxoglutarate dehydrogenase complex dihydrolipoamide acyltransferase (E2) component
MAGGTFTISNGKIIINNKLIDNLIGGVFGSLMGTPILNPP